MTTMDMVIMIGFGVPIVLLLGVFLVLVTWLQVCGDDKKEAIQ